MKVSLYEQLVRAGASRRGVLKGAANIVALAASSSVGLGSLTGEASAQDSLRAEILKIPGVGKGSPGENGGAAGDLYVLVHVRPHKLFGRKDDNLTVSVPVTFAEAALGSTITVPTLDNPVKVKVPAGTPNGRTLRVKGRGVPKRSGAAGDLLVTIEVKVPSNLDPSATSALRAYAQAEKDAGFDPRAGWAGL